MTDDRLSQIREWWIVSRPGQWPKAFNEFPIHVDSDVVTHVIEKSAYDRLLARLEIYEKALEVIESNHNMTVMSHSENFMDGALTGYSRQSDIAREALKQAEELK